MKEKNIEKLTSINNEFVQGKDLTKYNYIVILKDKFLSGWGRSGEDGHYQIILCNDTIEVHNIEYKVKYDKTYQMRFSTFYSLNNPIPPLKKNRSYSLRTIEQMAIFK